MITFSCSLSAFRDDDSYQRLFLRMSQELSPVLQKKKKLICRSDQKHLLRILPLFFYPSGFNSWSNAKRLLSDALESVLKEFGILSYML